MKQQSQTSQEATEVEFKRASMFFINLLSQNKNIPASSNLIQANKQSIWQAEMNDLLQQKKTLSVITSVNLECSAHGVFKKIKLANVFLDFLEEIFSYKGAKAKVKKLTLKISGFNLNSDPLTPKKQGQNAYDFPNQQNCKFSFIQRLKKIIHKGITNLVSLEIRINNVRFCKKEDLRDVLRLGLTNQTPNNLINLSYELGDWMFYKIIKTKPTKEKSNMNESSNAINEERTELRSETVYLTSNEFQQAIFDSILLPKPQQSKGPQRPEQEKKSHIITIPSIKRFRLQLSTLCYENQSFKTFISSIKKKDYEDQRGVAKYTLKGKKVTEPVHYFHYLMREFIKDVVVLVMPNLTSLQLDFRNWSKDFQMKQLKDQLVNINKKHETSKKNDEKLINNSSIFKKKNPKTQNSDIKDLVLFLLKMKFSADEAAENKDKQNDDTFLNQSLSKIKPDQNHENSKPENKDSLLILVVV